MPFRVLNLPSCIELWTVYWSRICKSSHRSSCQHGLLCMYWLWMWCTSLYFPSYIDQSCKVFLTPPRGRYTMMSWSTIVDAPLLTLFYLFLLLTIPTSENLQNNIVTLKFIENALEHIKLKVKDIGCALISRYITMHKVDVVIYFSTWYNWMTKM